VPAGGSRFTSLLVNVKRLCAICQATHNGEAIDAGRLELRVP